MEGEDSSPGSNSRRGSSVWRRLWALCLARCLPPDPLRPRALAAQGRRLLAPNLDPPLPKHTAVHSFAQASRARRLPLRGCGQQPDPGCFHTSVLYPRFRMHAHPTLQTSPATPPPSPASVSDPARLTVSPPSASHARSRFCPAASCPSTVPFFARMMQGRAVEWSREVTNATRQPEVPDASPLQPPAFK